MCGIVGIISEENVNIKQFNRLLINTKVRGEKATGIYTRELGVIKDGVDAVEFITKYGSVYDMPTNLIIGHCRNPTGTVSPPSNNENNHPMENDKGILIHNGSVMSMTELKDYEYKGKCDSEVLLSYITHYGLKEGLSHVKGTAAIAFIDKEDLNTVYLWRDTNPICVAYNHKEKTIIFGSTKDIICSSLPSKFGLFISPDWLIAEIPEYYMYKVELKEGKINMAKIGYVKPEGWKYSNGYQSNYGNDYSNYGNYTRERRESLGGV